MLYKSIKCSGKNIILGFETEKDACIFAELFVSPKTKPSNGAKVGFKKIVQEGKRVILTFPTEKRAKLCAAIMEYPDDYRHPLETYGKRCKNCSY